MRLVHHFRLAMAVGGLIAITCHAAPGPEHTAGYASKPIHMIVATVPGVPPDVVARIIADKLQPLLHQPVIVENRPGAIGTIGLTSVAHAPADGYTLGVLAMPYVVAPALMKVPFDFERDFAAVAQVTRSYSMLAVRTESALRSVDQLVERARARPGQVTFASTGNGTPSHLAGALLQRETGTRMLHIPYKGNAAVTALLAGDVDFMMGPGYALWPQVKAGKLRALAVTSPRRIDAYADVPTLAELGYRDVQITDWQGVLTPKGTPPEIVAILRSAIKAVLEMPDTKQKLDSMGLEAAYADSETFGQLIAAELRRWNAVAHDTGMKAD